MLASACELIIMGKMGKIGVVEQICGWALAINALSSTLTNCDKQLEEELGKCVLGRLPVSWGSIILGQAVDVDGS